MAVIDVDGLISAVSPDNPCGDDLEYDPEFQELERAAQGREGHSMGDAIIEAEGPDWSSVKKLAISILGRSKDMRAAVYLIRALIHTDGFVGLRDGLAVLKGLLIEHWDGVHPQLDPDDDNDPMFRMNTLVTLIDPMTTLASLRDAPMVRSKMLGTFTLKHILMARGDLSVPEGEDSPDPAHISGAFQDCDVEELKETGEAASEAAALLPEIEAHVTEQVGAAQAVDLSAFGEAMKPVQKELSEQLERRGVYSSEPAAEEAPAGPAGAGTAGGGGGGGPAAAMPQGGQPISGTIQSREDAIRMLDRVIEYFNKYEPSSPIPLLLHRAKRLVSKSFMEIMQDLAPDGLTQAQMLGGVTGSGGGGGGGGGWGDSGGGGAAPPPPAEPAAPSGGSDDGW